MRRRLLAAGILVVVGVLASKGLGACGDKFLLPARGLSFDEAYRATHPGDIAIYLPAGSPAPASEFVKVETLLTRAGHRVMLVRDAAQIAGRTDIVLTRLSDAGTLHARTGTMSPAPLLLAVVNRATNAELAACRLRYNCDLKSSDKPERFVIAVNTAMNGRAKTLLQKHGN